MADEVFGSLFGESPAAGAGSPTAIPEPSGTAIITSGIFVTLARAANVKLPQNLN